MSGEARARDPGDEAFLDLVFERILAALEEGKALDPGELLEGREHLRAEVEALLSTAGQATFIRHDSLPRVRGFVLQAEIGRGGMGTVYLARQETLGGRQVALKVLPASAALSARSRERFLVEARTIARLRHPNVVTVHDVIAEEGTCAYAMEWVEGASLGQLIDSLKTRTTKYGQHRVEPTLADVRELLGPTVGSDHDTYAVFVSRIAVALARALGELHRAGLVHRDVKPSNVLLRRDGTPLLSDFGLARAADGALTYSGQFVGTVAYASPEQLGGDPESLDARSDVYALGVTLYQALTLHLPFDRHARRETTPVGMLRLIESGRAAPLRTWNKRLPSDLETIVAKAIEADPARRYATAEELADDLERMLNLQPIRARPAGLTTRAFKLLRRNRGAAFGIAAGSVASLVVAALAVIYVFLVPDWVRAHERDARLALLDPVVANAIFVPVYWGQPGNADRVGDPALEEALGHYEAALRWAPFDREIRAERDAVRAVMSAQPEPPGLAATQGAALRNVGLQAYLRGDVDAALDAWESFERQHDPTAAPDPLVASGLGVLYLVREETARAYPRLRDACQAFPNVAFLTAYHADAALRCGDVDAAEELLAAAAAMPRHDPLSGTDRVRADLLAARGVDDAAEELYRKCTNSLIADLHYARFLESRGRREEAADEYVRLANVLRGTGVQREYVSFLERWWADLSEEQRLRELRSALDLDPTQPRSLVARLQAYVNARRIGGAEVSQSAPAEPTSARPLQGRSLTELAAILEVENTDRWNRIRSFPPVMKWLQQGAWRHPAPSDASKLLASVHADYQRVAARALAGTERIRGALGLSSSAGASLVRVRSEQKISAATGGFGGMLGRDSFGQAVAALGDLDGDGVGDLAVGANGTDDGGEDQGAVWILFLNPDGTVASERKISATTGGFDGDLDPHDFFGSSVATVGDLDGDGIVELAVGAYADDDGGFDHGAVWILFLKRDGTVSAARKISATAGGFRGDLPRFANFGISIAALGDLDGDGTADLAVGAHKGDEEDDYRGAIWILFLNPDGTVASEREITEATGVLSATLDPSDHFGSSLAPVGDLDDDGTIELAVGACEDDDGAENQGAVWILFLNSDGTVSSETKISATAGGFAGDLDPFDYFGQALAALGDLDGDGTADLAVGNSQDDDGDLDQGALWILFLNPDGTVSSERKLSCATGGFGGALDEQDSFGRSVVTLGDLDGDGRGDLAAGAPGDDDGGPDQGAVWILFLENVRRPGLPLAPLAR